MLPTQQAQAQAFFKELVTFYKTIELCLSNTTSISRGLTPRYMYAFRLSIRLYKVIYKEREM